jgi:hypothetical protein
MRSARALRAFISDLAPQKKRLTDKKLPNGQRYPEKRVVDIRKNGFYDACVRK